MNLKLRTPAEREAIRRRLLELLPIAERVYYAAECRYFRERNPYRAKGHLTVAEIAATVRTSDSVTDRQREVILDYARRHGITATMDVDALKRDAGLPPESQFRKPAKRS
ncbi:MAG: hypothetical protein KGJ13_07930 [Patescibacteria group bacterium]|nr:hypothetical protein [Patescibacteria group bacterium]